MKKEETFNAAAANDTFLTLRSILMLKLSIVGFSPVAHKKPAWLLKKLKLNPMMRPSKIFLLTMYKRKI
jgi:hypothetical protein